MYIHVMFELGQSNKCTTSLLQGVFILVWHLVHYYVNHFILFIVKVKLVKHNLGDVTKTVFTL